MITLTLRRDWAGAPLPPAQHVQLTIQPTQAALLVHVDAPHYGDPLPGVPPGPCWKLWEHEVVELFILGADERYLEVELGPGNHHLVLQLHGTRNVIDRMLPLTFSATVDGARWTGDAAIPWAMLPKGPHRINAYAIHGQGRQRRYLAWQPVPGERPDFHRLAFFTPIQLLYAE
ncbi:MAG: hypothetical protein AAFV53_35905 [Myxococcota bacterium]